MRIGELSRLTGVSTRLLRYYEQQGLLQAERTSGGYREYGADAQVRVRQIRGLLTAGLPTRVIAEILPCATGPLPALEACPSLLATLHAELADLDGRIETLLQSRAALADYLATARPATAPYAA
ncbi:MerR family transcriptional regulator [Kitasatospora sp. HPMI-4]|uniref:MerR family transcriptional regulator n=1 Tax=Kitasatospora sp. HPMI-4 TaxID=3448443 RepID=UPI003F1E3133